MSLSSLLLPSATKDHLDTELDSLFKTAKTAAGPSSRPVTVSSAEASGDLKKSVKKRKGDALVTEDPTKRRKSDSRGAARVPDQELKDKNPQRKEAKKTSKRDKKGKAKVSDDEAVEEENSNLENAYLKTQDRQLAQEKGNTDEEDNGEDASDEEQGGNVIPVHESLKKDKKSSSRSGPKLKYVPPNEPSEQRNKRTIFIGNLSTEVAQKRPLQKQLHRHILQYVPTAKIESTRFRSVAFSTPTTDLSEDTPDAKSPSKKKASPSEPKATRQHDLERASAWRERQEDESLKNDEKKFLTPSQKKKIAFINQEFHSSADTVNAYIVFAHPIPADQRPSNLPPPPEVMDPYEAAKKAVVNCDGSIFMERSIRVDLVGGKACVGADRKKSDEGEDLALLGADPKLSVFIGNLDFASKEEDLRVFFEGVVAAEKGAPLTDTEEGKRHGWVTRVRIVRDKDTQMGKGFAYVQFADRECVDEILAMEEGKLKFAKRKLRVQRCKTLPGSSTSTHHITSDGKKPAQGSSKQKQSALMPVVVPSVPRGDPALGEKLAGLSKDARKQAKAADADRVARRLAKKKARAVMAKAGSGVKIGGTNSAKDGKERRRVRKSGKTDASGSGKPGVRKAKSGRVRSDKAISKMNGKKSG